MGSWGAGNLKGGRGGAVSDFSKGFGKIEVGLQWDPSPAGEPPTDLDIVAATFTVDDPYGTPAYVVHFDSRSPDGTIFLNRDSTDGKGFGWDEVMMLELDRLDTRYARVVVGVAIQQRPDHKTFSEVLNPAMRVRKDRYTVLAEDDFASVPEATAATIATFARDESGAWNFQAGVHGFDEDPVAFTRIMGRAHQP
ncbi:TerD family protein [Streptomyces sp. NPDC002671]